MKQNLRQVIDEIVKECVKSGIQADLLLMDFNISGRLSRKEADIIRASPTATLKLVVSRNHTVVVLCFLITYV